VNATPLIAVLDSSVLVPRWSRFAFTRLAQGPTPLFVPVWSEWIIAETWRVLAWRWCAGAARLDAAESHALTTSANAMLRHLLPVMRLVTLRGYAGPPPWPTLPDPDDAPIWETAVVGGAQYVVSHNTRHFPPLVQGRHAYGGVEYLTAIEFVEDVLGESAAAAYGRALPAGGQVRSRRVP
jgi:hypothetical protein